MIEKIKTITYEVRSHGQITRLSEQGRVEGAFCLKEGIGWNNIKKPIIKRLIWHLQDVLKCMKQIEKEKEAYDEQK